jgi:uncharacterized protein (UPF0335 family)
MSKPGHNSDGKTLGFVDRLVNLMNDQDALRVDVKELKAEAKEAGEDVKEIAALAKLKRKGKDEAIADGNRYDEYLSTLGWLA